MPALLIAWLVSHAAAVAAVGALATAVYASEQVVSEAIVIYEQVEHVHQP